MKVVMNQTLEKAALKIEKIISMLDNVAIDLPRKERSVIRDASAEAHEVRRLFSVILRIQGISSPVDKEMVMVPLADLRQVTDAVKKVIENTKTI